MTTSPTLRRSCPRRPDDIGNQDRGQFAGLAHRATAEAAEFAGRVGSGMVRFPAALGITWKQEAHPCVSPGRSIHAGVDRAED
jgi:hypothetical protein